MFALGTAAEWQQFHAWRLPELQVSPAWQWKPSHVAPASPGHVVLFGFRAAFVSAVIQWAEINQNGMLREIEMDARHLGLATGMAGLVYIGSPADRGG